MLDLTLIITTSIIPSNPSCDLIQDVLNSYLTHEPDLYSCEKIIVCDCPKLSNKKEYKSGRSIQQEIDNYNQYIINLEQLNLFNTSILKCKSYRGFAMAIKDALELVKTNYVMIIQHDRYLTTSFGVKTCLQILSSNENIEYIGLSTHKSIRHAEITQSKYNINLEPIIFNNIKLVPLIFWYDSTHIASVSHYKEFVFKEHIFKDKIVKLTIGDFIEDKFGQMQREDIKSNGIQAHSKYKSYVLVNDVIHVKHRSGRTLH